MSARAVLISDVHYNMANLALADASMRLAIKRAHELRVPLIVAGDIHDTKAMLRGECVNAMIATFVEARRLGVTTAVIAGNHDLINEKGATHSLAFLDAYTLVIDTPLQWQGFHVIPYQSTTEAFTAALDDVPAGSTLIIHQGVMGSDMGEYVRDHSAVPKDILSDFRTISGHYHRAQDIKCGRPRKGAIGLMSYIGTPYTITFAEAKDGPKGFQILMDDGSLVQVPTNLRKHLVVERTLDDVFEPLPDYNPGDLVWLKVKGPSLELEKLTRSKIAKAWATGMGFKCDKIPDDAAQVSESEVETKTTDELMDFLIDSSPETPDNKVSLKSLWRRVMS